jgi:hypothetical protein
MKMTEKLKQHLINQACAGDESARIWLQEEEEEVKSKDNSNDTKRK